MVLIIETIVEVLKACVSPVALFILALMILIVYIFKAGTNYLNIKKIFKDYISIFSNARKHLWLFWGSACTFIRRTGAGHCAHK